MKGVSAPTKITAPPPASHSSANEPVSRSRPLLIGLYLLCLGSYSFWTFDHELWNPDETREGGIVWAMVTDHDLIVPHLNGRPFLEKPPLYYWTAAFLAQACGRLSPAVVRLPAVLYGLLGILAATLIARRAFGPRAGLLAGIVLATLPKYYLTAHFALTDLPLTAAVGLAYYGFYLLDAAGPGAGRMRRTGYGLLFVIAVAAAFLAKGLIGPLLIGAGLFFYLLWERKYREMALAAVLGGAGVALAAGPWLDLVLGESGWGSLKFFLLEDQWDRFTSASLGHRQGFGFYLYIFPANALPWLIVFIPAVGWGRERILGVGVEGGPVRLMLCWLGGGLLLLSLSTSKREIYLLPLFAPMAVLIGAWLDQVMAGKDLSRLEREGLKALAIIAGLVPLLMAGAGLYLLASPARVALLALPMGTAAAIVGAVLLRRRAYPLMAPYAALVSVGVIGVSSVLFAGLLDRERSYKPFFARVRAEVPAGSRLYGLHLSEMEEGAANFYLDRLVPNAPEPEELARMLAAGGDGTAYLLLDNRAYRNYRDRLTGFSEVLAFDLGRGSRHGYYLLKTITAAKKPG